MLTPAQRSLRSRSAAHTLHAQVDGREITAAARAKSPGQIAYWEKQVDPDQVLPDTERRRRAEHAKRAHFAKLALKSSQARSRRAAG